ncbi:MAG: AraC family transcriptional regulator [Alphaproteobacteria bacterium]|nr:AraC family transcriptional regulator [Alphaproteobacteria bacterium]
MNHPLTLLTTPALTLAGRNKSFPVGPGPGIKELWQIFMQDFGKISGQVGLRAYGVCHNFDGRGNMDYMCAVEVEDAGQVPGYLHTLQIPSRKTAVFTHQGPVEKLPESWAAIFNTHLPAAKLEVAHGPQFEVYGEDEAKIDIHIPVK